MTTRHITVSAVEGGWSLTCDGELETILFLSGARAEAQARVLAFRLSEAGDEVRLTVHDRSRAVVAQLLFSPLEAV